MIIKIHLHFFSFPARCLYYRNKLSQLLIRIVITITGTAIWRFPRLVPRTFIPTMQADVSIFSNKRSFRHCPIRGLTFTLLPPAQSATSALYSGTSLFSITLSSFFSQHFYLPWHCLYFFPLPHGHGSFLPTFGIC